MGGKELKNQWFLGKKQEIVRTLSLAGMLWERQSAKVLLGNGCEKALTSECLFVHCQQGLLQSVYVDDIKDGWAKTRSGPHVEKIDVTRGAGEADTAETSQVRTCGYVDTSSTSQMARDLAEYRSTCGCFFKGIVYGLSLTALLWARQFEKVLL